MKKSDIAIYISAVLTLILTTFVVFSTQNVTYDDKKMNDIMDKKNISASATNTGLIGDSGDKSSTSPLFENKVAKKSDSGDKSLLSGLDDKTTDQKNTPVEKKKTTSTHKKKSFADINSLDMLSGNSKKKKISSTPDTHKRTVARMKRTHIKRTVRRKSFRKKAVRRNMGAGKYHIVKYGDTMWKIAARYGTTTIRVIRANSLANPNILYPGMKIRIPS